MKVLYLTNVPAPYRVEYFNLLSQECDLTVVYEKSYSKERNKEWIASTNDNYHISVLKGISTGADSAFSVEIIPFLKKKYDVVVICGISSLTEILAIEYCRRHKIRFFLESDGGTAKSGRGIKEKLKKHLVSSAYGCFSTCDRHEKYYLTYGADKEKIYRYPFSSIQNHELSNRVLSKDEKNQIKSKLDISSDKMVLSVGRYIHIKGFDLLIWAASHIPSLDFYLVGGKPTEEYINLVKQYNAKNIHFVDFKSKDDLVMYYDAADYFVLATRGDVWGLVVNEAMARGLPVITTENCNAGLEMVKNNENGLIIPSDDKEALRDALLYFSGRDLTDYSKAALETAKCYTIEKMVQSHMVVFEEYYNSFESFNDKNVEK